MHRLRKLDNATGKVQSKDEAEPMRKRIADYFAKGLGGNSPTDALSANLIQKTVGAGGGFQDVLNEVVRGDLPKVAELLFNDVFKDLLHIKFTSKVGSGFFSNDHEWYTLSELREVVDIANNAGYLLDPTKDGGDGAVEPTKLNDLKALGGKVYTATGASAPSLNGKLFPMLDETKIPGKIPRDLFGRKRLDAIEAAYKKVMVGEAGKEAEGWIGKFLLENDMSNIFFRNFKPATSVPVKKLSAGLIGDATRRSFRGLRQGEYGMDASAFKLNGASGDKVALNLPVYVNLTGNVEAGKSVNTTGSVATKFGNTMVGVNHAYANTGTGFKADSVQAETSVMIAQKLGAAFAEVQFGSVDAKGIDKADVNGSRAQVTLGVDTSYVTPFVQLTHRNLDRQGLLMTSNVSDTTVALGAEVDVAKHATDAYTLDLQATGKVGYNSKSWTALGNHLGTDTGVVGSLDMKGALKLNTGVSFTSNLSFGSVAGTSAGFNVSLER